MSTQTETLRHNPTTTNDRSGVSPGSPRLSGSAEAALCWMCNDTGYCPCLFFGLKCQASAGRAKTAKELALAEQYRLDPRNILDYKLGHTGLKFYRRLKFPPGVYG